MIAFDVAYEQVSSFLAPQLSLIILDFLDAIKSEACISWLESWHGSCEVHKEHRLYNWGE